MFVIVIIALVRLRLFPEADTGFRQSQASLIWRELEEEDEGLDEGPRGLFRSALRRGQAARNRDDEDRTDGSVRRHRRRRMSDYPDDDCVRYFVLGTLVAVFALLVNFFYKSNWT